MDNIATLMEEDMHIPSLETKVWHNFLHETGLMEIWRNNTNQYQSALINYTKERNIKLLVLEHTGYVFRFNSQSEKLAWLLKWS